MVKMNVWLIICLLSLILIGCEAEPTPPPEPIDPAIDGEVPAVLPTPNMKYLHRPTAVQPLTLNSPMPAAKPATPKPVRQKTATPALFGLDPSSKKTKTRPAAPVLPAPPAAPKVPAPPAAK